MLTALEAKNAKVGMHADGGGLYLTVGPNGRSWLFRFTSPITGKRREMGLGRYPDRSLAEARAAASEARKLVVQGIDPLDARLVARAAARAAAPRSFAAVGQMFIESRGGGWRSAKHRTQWLTSLESLPFAKLPITAVTIDDVESALRSIWLTTPTSASRLLQRIVLVIDFAHDAGLRDTAADGWARRLTRHRLPRQPKSDEHHAALPWAELPELMARLRAIPGNAARALELTILTAARSGEVRGMRFDEVDGDCWTIPAERMKAGKAHRVPLSSQALELLRQQPRDGDLVFPNGQGKPLTDMMLLRVVRRLHPTATVHGFRSSFREWAGDNGHSRDAAEASLAHAVGNQVERAYRRSDLLPERAALMTQWADFCESSKKPN